MTSIPDMPLQCPNAKRQGNQKVIRDGDAVLRGTCWENTCAARWLPFADSSHMSK